MRNGLKHLLRPALRRLLALSWSFHQYAPRPLKIPASYRHTRPPPNPPAIAIVTPYFNQAGFIAATIESVLSQNYPRLSYLVKDANSMDGTRDILQAHGARLNWLSEPDAGQADAINIGFRHVSGDVMAWLNSDDLLLPGTLAYVAKFFAAHPEVDFIYGDRIVIDQSGQETARIVLPRYNALALRQMDFIPQETMFWRRRVWEALGGLDASYQFAMDWDFLLRAQGQGFRFAHLPRFLGAFRVYPQQKIQAWSAIGDHEQERLRAIWRTPHPRPAEITAAEKRHVLRTAACAHAYRLGLLRR